MLYIVLDNGNLQLWDEEGRIIANDIQRVDTIIDPCTMLYTGRPYQYERKTHHA